MFSDQIALRTVEYGGKDYAAENRSVAGSAGGVASDSAVLVGLGCGGAREYAVGRTAKVLRLGPNFRQGLGIADPFAIWVYPASAS